MDLEQEAKDIARIQSRLDLLTQSAEREGQELAKTLTRSRQAQDAQELLQHLAQAVQQQAHQRISEVVSSCLAAVFDDPYEFKIVFERKRGRTEAHLHFVRGSLEVDPLTASGGGMVDVAAFALRVACLVLHRPRLQRVVVLDEPFRFVSAQYQGAVHSMLENLSKKMEVQMIMVTHNERYMTGKVIDLS